MPQPAKNSAEYSHRNTLGSEASLRFLASAVLPFRVPHELFPVEHRFIDLDDSRLHYVDEGSGETLLLLHGNPAWCFLYRKIIAALKRDFRCVALDYPGYGMSGVPAGYGFTPKEHSVVVEHFVDRLELIWPLDGERRIRFFSTLMGGPVGRVLTSAFNFVPRFFFWRGFAKPLAPEVRAMYLAPWRKRTRRLAAVVGPGQLIAATDYLREVEAGLPQLSGRPALIVWGRRDFAFGEADAARFAKLFPRNKTIFYEDAAHFLQEDVGERIAAEFVEFSRAVH